MTTVETPLGTLWATARAAGVTAVSFVELPDDGAEGADHLRRLAAELAEWFAGGRRDFAVPTVIDGSLMEEAVWAALREVPYGSRATYGALARTVVDSPKPGRAARAVGRACGANPLLLIVPCHRAVAADGVGGYAGGLTRKRWLLDFEQAQTSPWSAVQRQPPMAAVALTTNSINERHDPFPDEIAESGPTEAFFKERSIAS